MHICDRGLPSAAGHSARRSSWFTASRIEDYALIGDCETAALVSKDGSIDWLCWPRFDSAACFSALLGDPSNGRWLIAAPAPNVKINRRYLPNTLILETEFTSADGENAAALIDFMPLRQGGTSRTSCVWWSASAAACRCAPK